MYALTRHVKNRIDYLLGLPPTFEEHDHDQGLPPQVRSAALFATVGDYEEYPGIDEALHERIVESSREPAEGPSCSSPTATSRRTGTPTGWQS